MKKSILKSMLLMVATSVMLVSCDPPIMDWNPIRIYIKVSNAEGQNLLDSVTPNNFLDKEISAEWMGDTYIEWITGMDIRVLYLLSSLR